MYEIRCPHTHTDRQRHAQMARLCRRALSAPGAETLADLGPPKLSSHRPRPSRLEPHGVPALAVGLPSKSPEDGPSFLKGPFSKSGFGQSKGGNCPEKPRSRSHFLPFSRCLPHIAKFPEHTGVRHVQANHGPMSRPSPATGTKAETVSRIHRFVGTSHGGIVIIGILITGGRRRLADVVSREGWNSQRQRGAPGRTRNVRMVHESAHVRASACRRRGTIIG